MTIGNVMDRIHPGDRPRVEEDIDYRLRNFRIVSEFFERVL